MGRRRQRATDEAWRRIAGEQAGVVSRGQLLDAGYSEAQIGALLDSGRWTVLQRGAYAVFTGPAPPMTRIWAAVLAAGPGAAVGGEAALWLAGVPGTTPRSITVLVPWERQATGCRGVRVVRRRGLESLVHPVARPPRIRVEEALLDLTELCSREASVVEVVFRVAPDRRTHPARIRAAMSCRSRLRHRRLLTEMLGEMAEGVLSALERRYRRGVESPHGLPRGRCNEVEAVLDERGRKRRNRHRDIRYLRRRVVVELDGGAAHPVSKQHLDHERDNSATLSGARVLQFGWYAVVDDPCRVARDVTLLLWREGWRGTPTPCSPTCAVTTLLARSG